MKTTTTIQACKDLGIDPSIKFLKAYRRGDTIFIGFTCGKPDEISHLRQMIKWFGKPYQASAALLRA